MKKIVFTLMVFLVASTVFVYAQNPKQVRQAANNLWNEINIELRNIKEDQNVNSYGSDAYNAKKALEGMSMALDSLKSARSKSSAVSACKTALKYAQSNSKYTYIGKMQLQIDSLLSECNAIGATVKWD